MADQQEPNVEIMAKILLDEANLAFCETAERKDEAGSRTAEGSVWDEGRMEGEFDQADYDKILELQLKTAKICDEHPDLESKTEEMFQSITSDNAEEIFKQLKEDPNIFELAKIAVIIFILRYPTVQSFVNKGHPLVLAMDEYMLENADSQNWHDYNIIAQKFTGT